MSKSMGFADLKSIAMRAAHGGMDYTKLKGFDRVAESMAANPEFKGLFGDKDPLEYLFSLFAEGKKELPKRGDAYEPPGAAASKSAGEVEPWDRGPLPQSAEDTSWYRVEKAEGGPSSIRTPREMADALEAEYLEKKKSLEAKGLSQDTISRKLRSLAAELDAARRQAGKPAAVDQVAELFGRNEIWKDATPLEKANLRRHVEHMVKNGESLFGEPMDAKGAVDWIKSEAVDAKHYFDQYGQPDDLKSLPSEESSRIWQAAKDFTKDEAGTLNIEWLEEKAKEKYRQLKVGLATIRDNVAELSGKMAPRLTRISRKSGEALTEYNSTGTFVHYATPHYIDKVMGKYTADADRNLAGAVMTERALRYTRRQFQRKAQEFNQQAQAARTPEEGAALAKQSSEWAEKVANVTSIIGADGSPLKTPDDYRQALASPMMGDIIKNWKEQFAPLMDANFRKSKGLEETDPINSLVQIPGEPINLKAIRTAEEDAPTVAYTRGNDPARGNLKGRRLYKNPLANERAGNADGYDLDLGAIIENTLKIGEKNARKAEMFRTLTEEGAGYFGKPSLHPEGFKEIDDVRPPRGTQHAAAGETSFYAKEYAYGELRQALKVDEGYKLPGITPFLNALTKASIASTVEAAYHTKNLLTGQMRPRVIPVYDLMNNVLKQMAGNAEFKAKIVDLASMGAMKAPGMETGMLLPKQYAKYDPTTWMSKLIDVTDKAMRVTLSDAYDRVARSKLTTPTETGKRDFINGALGQYNRAAQHKLVVMLRDTGIGPFATAGTRYYMEGLAQVFTAGTRTGIKASSLGADVQLRAEQIGKLVAVVAGSAAMNYMLWGRADGDDKTPLGAIKLGEDKNTGRTSSYDLTNFTGLTRGMRELGLLALLEGKRKGQKGEAIKDRAADDAMHAAMHPGFGPGVAFMHTLATGENSIGMKVAEKPARGESKHWQNFVAALKQANPVYSSLSGSKQPGKEVPLDERLWDLAGPYGPKFRYNKGHKYPAKR